MKKIFGRSTLTYFIMLVVNPVIILLFQNCSVATLSDVKTKSPVPAVIESAKEAPADLSPGN